MVHPANVKRITRFVESVEPREDVSDSISAEEFFTNSLQASLKGRLRSRGIATAKTLPNNNLPSLPAYRNVISAKWRTANAASARIQP